MIESVLPPNKPLDLDTELVDAWRIEVDMRTEELSDEVAILLEEAPIHDGDDFIIMMYWGDGLLKLWGLSNGTQYDALKHHMRRCRENIDNAGVGSAHIGRVRMNLKSIFDTMFNLPPTKFDRETDIPVPNEPPFLEVTDEARAFFSKQSTI